MGTDELRSTGELFGHLLANDAVAWRSMLGLDGVRITEEDTTSSSRIFIKTMFQETAEQLGVRELPWRLLSFYLQRLQRRREPGQRRPGERRRCD
jgi:pre-mRNA-splicing factor CWC22